MQRRFFWFCGLLALIWLYPAPALAYIPHWDPKEGFFVRQFSYLVFLVAMFYLFFELKQGGLQKYRGFRFLAWASLLFALWNLDCFVGQFLSLNLDSSQVVGPTGSLAQRLHMADAATWVYYLTKLDHLLLVPAYYLFYLGIKAFRQQPNLKNQ